MIALLLTLSAQATDLTGEADTPWTVGTGHGAVGLFRPLTVGVGPQTDLGTTGLASLVAPRVEVKHTFAHSATLAVAGIGALGVPSLGLHLLRGSVLSSDPNRKAGFAATVDLGAIGGVRAGDWTVSLKLLGRVGLPSNAFTLETPGFFFLDPMLAPLTEGPALRTALRTDWLPASLPLGLTLELGTQLLLARTRAPELGKLGPDHFARLFGLVGLGEHWAIGLGLAGAHEHLPWGRDLFLLPLLDVQARW